MKSKLILYIRTIFTVGTVIPFTLICSLVSLLIVGPLGIRPIQDFWIRFWARVTCWLAGARVHVQGDLLSDIEGKVVFVSNHVSAYDIPVLLMALPKSFRMAAKAELFDIPVFGRALRALGFIPVARGKLKAGKAAVDRAKMELQKGRAVWFAPEGTRYPPGQMGNFKLGAFKLACETNSPVVPVTLFGTDKVLPNKTLWVNSGKWKQDVIVEIQPSMRPSLEQFSELSQREPWEVLRDEARGCLEKSYSRLRQSSADHR